MSNPFGKVSKEREWGIIYGREAERLEWTEALVEHGHHTPDEESPEQALRAAFGRLKARLAVRERRIRLARKCLRMTEQQWDDETTYITRHVIGDAAQALDLRKPLPKRGAKR